MKGLILAAGRGTRLRPLTYTTPKPILPIANKPTLCYALETMTRIGITDIGIVVNEQGIAVAEELGDGGDYGARLCYPIQHEPKGVAHAVSCAKEFLGADPFMLYLGDTLYDYDFTQFKLQFETDKPSALIAVAPVPNPQRYGIAEVEGARITGLVEKPAEPKSNLALAGIYFFSPDLWDIMPQLKPSQRGELEITDAAQMLISNGKTVLAGYYDGWWQDTGTPDYMLKANRYWLSKQEATIVSPLDEESSAKGSVKIGSDVSIKSTSFIGPCSVADNCIINNAQIGENVSIGKGCAIKNVSLSNVIIMDDAVVNLNGQTLQNALIGRKARITNEITYTLIGDDSAIKC